MRLTKFCNFANTRLAIVLKLLASGKVMCSSYPRYLINLPARFCNKLGCTPCFVVACVNYTSLYKGFNLHCVVLMETVNETVWTDVYVLYIPIGKVLGKRKI